MTNGNFRKLLRKHAPGCASPGCGRARDGQSGFTLIEAMVVVAISAILASVAVPSYRVVMTTTRVSAATNDLLAAIQLARSEAIRVNGRVTLCRSLNSNDTVPTCSDDAGGAFAADDWAAGWVVFVKDQNPSVSHDPAVIEAADLILARQPADPARGNTRLTVRSAVPAQPLPLITFSGFGRPVSQVPHGPGRATFWVDFRDVTTNTPSDALRCVNVGFTGRSESGRYAQGEC